MPGPVVADVTTTCSPGLLDEHPGRRLRPDVRCDVVQAGPYDGRQLVRRPVGQRHRCADAGDRDRARRQPAERLHEVDRPVPFGGARVALHRRRPAPAPAARPPARRPAGPARRLRRRSRRPAAAPARAPAAPRRARPAPAGPARPSTAATRSASAAGLGRLPDQARGVAHDPGGEQQQEDVAPGRAGRTSVCTERSSSDMTTAAATPPGQPRTTAHASTAAITQNDGIVEACRSSIASLCTYGVDSSVAAATAKSATQQRQPTPTRGVVRPGGEEGPRDDHADHEPPGDRVLELAPPERVEHHRVGRPPRTAARRARGTGWSPPASGPGRAGPCGGRRR